MSLTSRVLPRDEWPRLADTYLSEVWTVLPESAQVVVVENDQHTIVGTCTLLTALHAEGFGIADDYRARGVVARMLMREVADRAEAAGYHAVLGGASSEEMATYLARLGGQPAPMTTYAVPLANLRGARVKED